MPPCIPTNTTSPWFIPSRMKNFRGVWLFVEEWPSNQLTTDETGTAQPGAPVQAPPRRTGGVPPLGGKARSDSGGYLFLLFITRSTSRLPSRSLMVSRLSCSALPLASAISHFT